MGIAPQRENLIERLRHRFAVPPHTRSRNFCLYTGISTDWEFGSIWAVRARCGYNNPSLASMA